MLKPLTFCLGLALALGVAGVSKAGGYGGCATCGIASPQGTVVSPQSVVAAPCDTCYTPKKHCFTMPHITLPKFHCPKPSWTYEWVLKKKLVWNHGCNDGCGGGPSCGSGAVYPTGQIHPTGQAYPAPQTSYSAPYTPAGQHAFAPPTPGEMRPAPVLSADEVPPAPTIATGSSSLLQLTPSGR
jgi:hypothetical protein